MWMVLAALAVFAGGALFVERRSLLHRAALLAVHRAARKHGIHMPSTRTGRDDEGDAGELTLHAETRLRRRTGQREMPIDSSHTRLTLRGNGHLDRSLVLEPEGALAAIGKVFGEHDLSIGDPDLDDRVFVRGDEVLVRALFDEERRRLVFHAVATLGLRVKDGDIHFEADDLHRDPIRLEHIIARMLELAEVVQSGTRDPIARIVENVRGDPVTAVRVHNLELALKIAPEAPGVKAIVEAMLDARDVRLRMVAANAAGPAGMRAIAAVARDPTIAEAERVLAARQVALRHPDPAPILLELLHSPARALRLAAIEGLGRRRARAAVDALCFLLGHGSHEDAEAAAEALRFIGDPSALPALVAELEDESTPLATRVAIARALGSLGDRETVLVLSRYTSGRRTSGELRDAAKSAVEWIQRRETKRIGDDPRGGLALVDAHVDAGALSVAPSGGELAIAPDDPRGNLSVRRPETRRALEEE